jgi:multidrug efflux system outer membrane protein
MKRAALAIATLLGGCTVGPDYQKPDIATPAGYEGVSASRSQAPLSLPTSAQADLSQWWIAFDDAELQSLVTRALSQNLDLLTAASRVREARQQEIVEGAAALPQVTAAGNAINLHSNSSLLSKLAPSSGTGGSAGATPGSTNIHLYSVGFDATWELDIFGGVRRSVEAAQATTEANLWGMRDGEVTVTAEIAADYLMLRAVQTRIALLQSEATQQHDVLVLTAARRKAGFVTQFDVNQQDALIASTQSQIPALEAQVRVEEHAIGVLLGEQPEAMAAELDSAKPLPAIPTALPAGLPSDLLRRRPDVREAERDLAAATAQVGVAVADLYPKFNLLGALSLASPNVAGLFSTNNLSELGLGSVMWPVFKGGEIHANIRAKEEEEKQAYYAYQKAVLAAIQDAEDSLARYTAEQRRFIVLQSAAKSDESSVNIAVQQYRVGLVNYISVLTAQSNALAARDQLAQSNASLATDLVSSYKALGGGWRPAKPDEPEQRDLLDRVFSQ